MQGHGSYARFAAMIAVSTLVMFGLMYLNTYAWAHVRFSETRAFMAVLMGGAMATVMMAFMLGMYPKRTANLGILAGGVVLGVAALWFVRSQATVGDEAWMKAMIPHHSIAILTSENANLSDPRVRALADSIIETQREEIAAMEWLIEDIEANGEAASSEDARARPVPQLDQNL